MKARVIAHKGDIQHAPESTQAAFQSAIEKGADAIEFDVHLTADEQLVVHHDYYLGFYEELWGGPQQNEFCICYRKPVKTG